MAETNDEGNQTYAAFCEQELFSLEICGRMTQAVGANSIDDAERLFRILNDPGSESGCYGYMAAFQDKFGTRALDQRTKLEKAATGGERFLEAIDSFDFNSYEMISAGYAKEDLVFTATATSISSEVYGERDRDIAAARRLVAALRYAADNIDTSSKEKLGLAERYANHLVYAYEAFTGNTVSGERSYKGGPVRTFLWLGLSYITEGRLSESEMNTVVRRAAEASRRRV